MSAWNNYFYGPVAAIRPFLFQRLFLLLVGTDVLVLMTERGSRYGIDGFNVAHFAWLDAIQPLPTATWYVGILMLVCLLAYTAVLAGPSRFLLAAIAILYTYAWAMSRHDSYLHHYMISLILACMVFFPPMTSADLRQSGAASSPRTCAWAFRLLGATVGVIYVYTSLAKADAEWCGGHTLQAVVRSTEAVKPIVDFVVSLGVPSDSLWSVLATMVIPLELTIAVSYFLAVRQDEPGRKWLRRWCTVAWVLAIGLHANNEFMNLSIQWFGYYMMFLATFFFLPERVLLAVGKCVVLPAQWWQNRVAQPVMDGSRSRRLGVGMAVTAGAAVVLYAASRLIDLPGALWALPLAAAGVVLYAVLRQLPSQVWLHRESFQVGAAVGLAGLLMAVVASLSSMRHEYYFILGKELQNLTAHGDAMQEAALAAYEQAEQYRLPYSERRVELLINQGLAHRRLGNVPLAIEHYQRAAKIDPTNAHVFFNMGIAYDAASDLERAAQCLEQATELRPDYAIAYRELGRIQERRGDVKAALVNLRTAGRLLPDDPQIQLDIDRLTDVLRQGASSQKYAKPGTVRP